MSNILEIRDLQVRYGGIEAVKGISLDVPEGEIVTLIGANGAGKTTLVKSILGEIKHEGTVGFESHDGEKISKVTIGYVPQHLDFDRSAPVSVEDFLLLGRTKRPVCFSRSKKISAELDEALELLVLDGELLDDLL